MGQYRSILAIIIAETVIFAPINPNLKGCATPLMMPNFQKWTKWVSLGQI